ncbi:uncharacterized protein P884DRAFT_245791 [Thermothelomyces heterothallicus CBS 202.75]|uniref:uncharacterized protein n=1 Tax=Thermothelomyces heterothallicus CBS 202.75 TaxID=1149848 RepID=UPI0037425992
MGQFFETIPEYLMKWILDQKMFWVATAPLAASGHVNVSPKGGPYFGLLDDRTFWYMDLTGSGTETIAHLYEPGNGRITVLFSSFEGPPRIVRLFGHGTVLERPGHETRLPIIISPEQGGAGSTFDDFVKKHDVEVIPSSRSIIIVRLHQVATSCGYSVPFYEFKGFRATLNEVFAKKEEKFLQGASGVSRERYWAYKNSYSVDGLPGMRIGYETHKREGIAPIEKMVGPGAPRGYAYRNSRRFSAWHLVLVAVLSVICTVLSFPLLVPLLQRIYEPAVLSSFRSS